MTSKVIARTLVLEIAAAAVSLRTKSVESLSQITINWFGAVPEPKRQRSLVRTFLPHTLAALATIAVALGVTPTATMAAETQREIPIFEVDPTWPKVPPQWKIGTVSSINSDNEGNIYILQRPRSLQDPDFAKAAPPVLVFDPSGNFVRAWGGEDSHYEWPQREHGIYIDTKGFVWVGGNSCPPSDNPRLKPVNDDQLLKFTRDGKFIMQIGHSNQSKGNADTYNLSRPADVQVYQPTNELFVADGYGNHRVIVFDADTGAFKRMWGAFGNKPIDDDHCGTVRVTNWDLPGPQQFGIAHSLRVANDGMVYVADRENRRIQSFTLDGKFVKQLLKADSLFARNLALSPDQGQNFLYVGNGASIEIVDRKKMELIGTIDPPGNIGGGHLIATDPKGNIYVAGATKGMQKLTFKGMKPLSLR